MTRKILPSLLSLSLLAAGCSIDINKIGTPIGPMPPSGGMVVGDEPVAVQAGASMLARGGNAADAAVATYFALAVTYPVAAGLGGGGLCLVRNPDSDTVESIDFLPRNVRSGGPFAVPGNVRGFALLHNEYGHLHWQDTIVPAEAFANLGFPMSRALAARVAGAADVVRLDAGLAKVFMDQSGNLHREGDMLRNQDLASSLAEIRTRGPNALYGGSLGSVLIGYAAGQNGPIARDELARYAPRRASARMSGLGKETVFLPAARTGAGKLAGAVFDSLARLGTQAISPADVAAAVAVVLKTYGVDALPDDLGATGFAAVDHEGQAVACAVTMDGPFGSGRTAADSGITLATAPSTSQTGLAVAFLTPVLTSDGETGPVALAGTGAGGAGGTAAVLSTVAALASGDDTARAEAVPPPSGAAPRQSANVIICKDNACRTLAEPGAHGLGTTVETHSR